MVRIVDYKLRSILEGDPFFALIVQGGVQLVKSKETGNYYATAKKASMPSTFDEETCKALIGEQLDGTIEKVECEPYEMTIEETGEILELDYRWVFVRADETLDEAVKAQEEEALQI